MADDRLFVDAARRPKKVAAPDATGLWMTAETEELDHQMALDKGHAATSHDGKRRLAAPHGTYTKKPYYRVHLSGKDAVENAVFRIFDEDGNFGQFVWNDSIKVWASVQDPLTFELKAGSGWGNDKARKLTVFPTLALQRQAVQGGGLNKQVLRTHSLGNPRRGRDLPKQFIRWDNDTKTFYWTQEGIDKNDAEREGLEFIPGRAQPRVAHDPHDPKNFGDVFQGDTHAAQISLLFVGFNVCTFKLYQRGMLELPSTGTLKNSNVDTNPKQDLAGKLLFTFPTNDSFDMVRSLELQGQPYMPLGMIALPEGTKWDQTHTEVVSSVSGRTRAWSVSMGFSAGLEGLLSAPDGSYGRSNTSKEERESRFTVSRKVENDWHALMDVPSLELHPEYVKQLRSRLRELLAGETVRWNNIKDFFGTHYAHAVTYGKLEFSEVRLSRAEEFEAMSTEVKYNLKTGASLGNLVKGEGGIAATYQWANEKKLSKSIEDVLHFHWGGGADYPHGLAIYFDLRPAYELLNPVFLKYNPAAVETDLLSVTPFVWYELRQSFADFLTKEGVNRQLETSCLEDYTPRLLTLKLSEIKLTITDRDVDTMNYYYFASGKISVDTMNGAQSLQEAGIDQKKIGRAGNEIAFSDPAENDAMQFKGSDDTISLKDNPNATWRFLAMLKHKDAGCKLRVDLMIWCSPNDLGSPCWKIMPVKIDQELRPAAGMKKIQAGPVKVDGTSYTVDLGLTFEEVLPLDASENALAAP